MNSQHSFGSFAAPQSPGTSGRSSASAGRASSAGRDGEQTASELQRIWARIPNVNCKQKCQECCGPILMSHAEYRLAFGSKPPIKTYGDFPVAVDPISGSCPKLLRSGECGIYEMRPTVCRLYGAVKAMQCPFGCIPDRWLSDEEAFALLDAANRLAPLAQEGGRP